MGDASSHQRGRRATDPHRGAAFQQSKHDRAIDLILDGYARSCDDLIEQASNPPRLQTRGARPLFQLGVVAKASPDLDDVIRLLRTDRISARGVARAERVMTDAASPLYGYEVEALLEELDRVRRLLSG
jgi:hypothetical protein